jgi:hypothetical protein
MTEITKLKFCVPLGGKDFEKGYDRAFKKSKKKKPKEPVKHEK